MLDIAVELQSNTHVEIKGIIHAALDKALDTWH